MRYDIRFFLEEDYNVGIKCGEIWHEFCDSDDGSYDNSNNHHVYFSLLLFVLDSGAVCKITAAIRREKKSGKRLNCKCCSFKHDKPCNPCLTRSQNGKETRQKVKLQMLFIQTWQTMQPMPDSQSEQKRNQAKGSTANSSFKHAKLCSACLIHT